MAEVVPSAMLKCISVCILGPDRPGLLARIADCARKTRVDMAFCNADVHRARAMIFFGCEGADADLDSFCRAIEESFPGDDDEQSPQGKQSSFVGYSVDIRDVPRFVTDAWSKAKLILYIESENAIGLLANVTSFLSREGFNLAYYRGKRFFVDDETEEVFSRHTFEVRAPLGYFDREAFQRKLLAFKQEQFYHVCELRDP